MRIRTLSFTGVGPYRDPPHIDFDQLHGTGLYLIDGPTGAGKSTIIDAIVYALYGRLLVTTPTIPDCAGFLRE